MRCGEVEWGGMDGMGSGGVGWSGIECSGWFGV